MWMNVPVSILFVIALRILSNEVDFHWKARSFRRPTYLSHLEKKQLSVNDPRLSTSPPAPKWKRKIDSPLVEAAIDEFIDKVLRDFVSDLWYSEITPDKEFPEQIRAVVKDVLGEISGRVKELNLVDLLTRDIVDLIGDHLDLYRRNQAVIGADVMGTLSSEERDERLKHHLMASKELHPALISPECEYKVLQRFVGGILAVVLRPREAQCPLVRSIARELVTSLVMQPIMDFASPTYINELIEYLFLATTDDTSKEKGEGHSASATSYPRDHFVQAGSSPKGESTLKDYVLSRNEATHGTLDHTAYQREPFLEEPIQPRSSDWARVLEAATQRRTEVLAPENLENMWTKGRNYRSKVHKNIKMAHPLLPKNSAMIDTEIYTKVVDNSTISLTPGLSLDTQISDANYTGSQFSQEISREVSIEDTTFTGPNGNQSRLRRSNSTSALKVQLDNEPEFTVEGGGPIISEFYNPHYSWHNEDYKIAKNNSDMVLYNEGVHFPKLKCRVIGAYFEKIGSKSFAVYSIAVTDAERKTWFVKRRYRNFERLHRHLKDIPNYTLHLPPKRIFSSSTEDAFVHQRCIQLDKYLQDLLSIANVAEQHEVWDFLSVSSKNYSFGKSSSVMRSLAVNVDEAVDDIVRQFKGVSDGLIRKVAGSSSSAYEASTSTTVRNLSYNEEEVKRLVSRQSTNELTISYYSDNDENDKNEKNGLDEALSGTPKGNHWHSDNELNSKSFPPRVIRQTEEGGTLNSEKKHISGAKLDMKTSTGYIADMGDQMAVPPEWTPPNVSVPLLNLVDKIFQLKRRGWIRRQVFWISKQILQLIMEDAIDDWLLRQIHWLRTDAVIAEGIRWVQDVLWPDGIFFMKLENYQSQTDNTQLNLKSFQTTSHLTGNKVSTPASFEQQLEAVRRASDVKKIIFGGAPTALVSLIGPKQYRRCAKDVYYFLQSTTCIKQLAYGILEVLLVSVFPELRDLVRDVHQKSRA